jgi:hypothetical protein
MALHVLLGRRLAPRSDLEPLRFEIQCAIDDASLVRGASFKWFSHGLGHEQSVASVGFGVTKRSARRSRPAAPGASQGGETQGRRRRSEIARRGLAGVAVSLMRTRSATACGLRATALRCSAPRASSRGRRRSRSVLTATRTAPARSPRPRCAGQPWAPALLAAPEIARRQPPPPHSTTSPRWGEKRLKCAREGERERQARSAAARARVRPIGAPTRPAERPCPQAERSED